MVVVARQRVYCGVGAQGRAGLAELALVLAEVVFQLVQLPGLGQAGDDVQVLAEIMPQAAGLLHVFPQLHITAGFHAQKLVFPVQLGVPGVLLRHPVHLVQQQEDAQQ